MLVGLVLGGIITFAFQAHAGRVASTDEEPVEGPAEVVIEEVAVEERTQEWSQERIVQEILTVFWDAPIMLKVARCEGVKDGVLDPTVVNPTNGSYDVGIFQISTKYHGTTWKALGYTDMTDVRQNLAYARHLYDRQGLGPWEASRGCWSR